MSQIRVLQKQIELHEEALEKLRKELLREIARILRSEIPDMTGAAGISQSSLQIYRAMNVVTAAVHLCNDQAAYDRHALLFSLNQALIDNGFKVP